MRVDIFTKKQFILMEEKVLASLNTMHKELTLLKKDMIYLQDRIKLLEDKLK